MVPRAIMRKPDILIVDGHAFSWKRLCELRKAQLEAWQAAQARQPALFELKMTAVRNRAHRVRPLRRAEMLEVARRWRLTPPRPNLPRAALPLSR